MGSTYLNEGNHNGAKNPYDAVGRSYLVISNSTLRENYDVKHSSPSKITMALGITNVGLGISDLLELAPMQGLAPSMMRGTLGVEVREGPCEPIPLEV